MACCRSKNLLEEDVVGQLDNQQHQQHEEEDAHEGGAAAHGDPGSRQRAQDVAHGHRCGHRVHDVAGGNEEGQRGHVGGDIDQFRASRSEDEIEAEHADEQENQEAARAWAEQAVIKTDGAADDDGQDAFTRADGARLARAAEILLDEGVDGHDDDQHQHHRAHHLLRHIRYGGRADEGHDKGAGHGRQHQQPRDVHLADKRAGGKRGAAGGRQLIRAQQGRGGHVRHQVEQGRQLYQPAPAHGGVDQAGKEGK